MDEKYQTFIENLKSIADNPQPSLAKDVALEALSYDTEDIHHFFEDLLQYGCISGMISSLVYYSDTEAFFDNHYHEIMELKTAYEQEIGQPMEIPYHLKNHLAWFAFEETARKLWQDFQDQPSTQNNFSTNI